MSVSYWLFRVAAVGGMLLFLGGLSRLPALLEGAVLVCVLGVIGWFVYVVLLKDNDSVVIMGKED